MNLKAPLAHLSFSSLKRVVNYIFVWTIMASMPSQLKIDTCFHWPVNYLIALMAPSFSQKSTSGMHTIRSESAKVTNGKLPFAQDMVILNTSLCLLPNKCTSYLPSIHQPHLTRSCQWLLCCLSWWHPYLLQIQKGTLSASQACHQMPSMSRAICQPQ